MSKGGDIKATEKQIGNIFVYWQVLVVWDDVIYREGNSAYLPP